MGLEAIISVASGLTFFSMSGEEGPVAYNKRNKVRVYASQNGQKKGRSLKITKHILSRFLFHKKLI